MVNTKRILEDMWGGEGESTDCLSSWNHKKWWVKMKQVHSWRTAWQNRSGFAVEVGRHHASVLQNSMPSHSSYIYVAPLLRIFQWLPSLQSPQSLSGLITSHSLSPPPSVPATLFFKLLLKRAPHIPGSSMFPLPGTLCYYFLHSSLIQVFSLRSYPQS